MRCLHCDVTIVQDNTRRRSTTSPSSRISAAAGVSVVPPSLESENYWLDLSAISGRAWCSQQWNEGPPHEPGTRDPAPNLADTAAVNAWLAATVDRPVR